MFGIGRPAVLLTAAVQLIRVSMGAMPAALSPAFAIVRTLFANCLEWYRQSIYNPYALRRGMATNSAACSWCAGSVHTRSRASSGGPAFARPQLSLSTDDLSQKLAAAPPLAILHWRQRARRRSVCTHPGGSVAPLPPFLFRSDRACPAPSLRLDLRLWCANRPSG